MLRLAGLEPLGRTVRLHGEKGEWGGWKTGRVGGERERERGEAGKGKMWAGEAKRKRVRQERRRGRDGRPGMVWTYMMCGG